MSMPSNSLDLVMSQRDFLRFRRMRIRIHDAVGKLAARRFQNQLRRAPAGPIANAHVRAALKAVGRFGAQIQFLGSARGCSAA